MTDPIVIAIDGTSASGKSTNSKLVAKALNFVHVDTGAMYRALAWYCLKHGIDVHDPKAVAAACRRWKTALRCVDGQTQLVVEGYYPAQEIRTPPFSSRTDCFKYPWQTLICSCRICTQGLWSIRCFAPIH